ncbi:hypothetical protein ACHQM5_029597 [Ranunculus cassubicifolius]
MEIEYHTIDPLKPNFKTITHYKPYKIFKEPSFEFKVIYMRIISISSLDMQQTSMTINFPPRDPQTCLQINGIKIHSNEKTSRTLNKHREDAFMSESVFVNTDRIKFKGKFLPFEVQIDGCSSVLVYGGLKRKEGVEIKDECMWDMECREGDFGGKEFNGGFVDAYVAGRCLGKPLLLNEVVELKKWKDLDCFLEDDGTKSDTSKDMEAKCIQQLEIKNSAEQVNLNAEKCAEEEEEGPTLVEEGELSWFNAGVRLGIGLGVGMSLGVGVGLGLIMRTYSATSGVLKKFVA